eukprot:CAMPEP_0194255926 /NCGR_PEP_ID=MMETSP0158-20130606/35598_1 /TAXON_ID=33649 /ORGANISM="Thalassionema nitzschioides, Strain L26-B" /LENGTH=84 /DNA_ID=CAMNT_0038994437 /DNA_START=305 /DNA_END=559 /DNA_ORIENTATION=-
MTQYITAGGALLTWFMPSFCLLILSLQVENLEKKLVVHEELSDDDENDISCLIDGFFNNMDIKETEDTKEAERLCCLYNGVIRF